MCPPASASEAKPGDANGDGAADLADVAYLRDAVTATAGPAPWCADAVDIVGDDLLLLDDAVALLHHLYEGAFDLPDRSGLDCTGTGAPPAAACADVAWSVRWDDADKAFVRLTAPTLAVSGWSVSVSAEGCTITAATTEGTAAAPRSAGGARDSGYDATFVQDGGGTATSAVLLGLVRPATVTPAEGVDVLALEVTKGEGCGCTLSIGEAAQGLGKPVAPIVVAGGAAYAPPAIQSVHALAECPQ